LNLWTSARLASSDTDCDRHAGDSGKTAVVTGAASGIGLALSRRLGSDGMQVMMAEVEEPALAAAANSLAADGVEVATCVTDVSDADSVEALARATLDRFGTVHVLCNNAGIGGGGHATARHLQWCRSRSMRMTRHSQFVRGARRS